MKSNKPYTNVTFTRRHDHEAGSHRAPRAAAEPRVCAACGAVYHRRRWVRAQDAAGVTAGVAGEPPRVVFCPGCRQRKEGVASGFLTLDGSFFVAHKDEILHFVEREVGRAQEDNPLSQIVGFDVAKDGGVVVKTTTEHLVHRLGRGLASAFKGHVDFDYSHENKVARVHWRRDLAPEAR